MEETNQNIPAEEVSNNKAQMDELRPKIDILVEDRNIAAVFGEKVKCAKIDAEIKDLVSKYDECAKAECFATLLSKDDPMKAAAEMLRYPTITVKVVEAEISEVASVQDVTRAIDPLELHKKSKNGIGAVNTWMYQVSGLYCNLIAYIASGIGVNAKTVRDTIKMSEAVRKYSYNLNPDSAAAKTECFAALTVDLQSAVESMIGAGYTVTSEDTNFVEQAIASVNKKKSHTLTATRDNTFRCIMLGVCGQCITRANNGNALYSIEYKTM